MCKRLQPWLLGKFNSVYEASVNGRKRDLIAGLEGRLLEIGPGTGANLKYYRPGVDWFGVEPNPFMHMPLLRAASAAGVRAHLSLGSGECLEYEPGSFDAVVGTLVLCSVNDVHAVLCEIRRVLRPGGRFVFIEHVAAPPSTRTRMVQRLVSPLWGAFADGCRPSQETGQMIESVFGPLDAESFLVPFPVIGPHLAGTATKG